MISDVVQAINHAIVTRHLSIYDIAAKVGRDVTDYSAEGNHGTIARTMKVPGTKIRGFRTMPNAANDVVEEVVRLYDDLTEQLKQMPFASPISFKLCEKVAYKALSNSDDYTFTLVVDYVEKR